MELLGAEIRNILDMCKDTKSSESVPLRVNIPHYQRPYKWDKERIKNLIYDFKKNKTDDNNEYFVGSVVLVKNTKLGSEWQDIIDGQQRVTTVFLLNYLRFLLLRAFTEDLIIRKSSGSFGDQMSKLKECYGAMFGSKKEKAIENAKQDIISKIDEFEENDDIEKEKLWSEILALYQKVVGLPEKDLSCLKDYRDEYEKNLCNFLESDDLALRYSRDSYNKKLKIALSKVMLIADITNHPKIEYVESDDPIINQYINALVYEFDAIKEMFLDGTEKPIVAIKKIIAAIDEMLVSIKFCAIMTGNENDAYTLFEVLNDRAMKVDDLDLIKNLFLKEYCNKSGDDESTIDKNVSEIDSMWGEDIFSNNLSQSRTKLISYLGTIFLTADEEIYTNKVEKYREILDKKYLSVEYKDKPYTSLNIKNDIKIYHMIKIIFEEFEIHAIQTENDALKAELDNSKSITYKTVHLVNALSQSGVLAAITNLILRTYIDNHIDEKSEIDIDKFRKYIKDLRDDAFNISEEYSIIHKWSFEIWKACLLAKDYGIPRMISKKIIQLVSVFNNSITDMHIDAEMEEKLKNELYDWTEAWQYGSPKQNLKVKILFIQLFSTHKEEKGLKLGAANVTFKTDKLQLDHLEAKNPNQGYLGLYFAPSDPTVRREKIVNGIGNFMLLDQEDNNEKNNLPLMRALEYYDKMCPAGHWLIEEVKDILEDKNCHNSVPTGNETIKIPNDNFFIERRKKLQKYFLALLKRKKITDNEMVIV